MNDITNLLEEADQYTAHSEQVWATDLITRLKRALEALNREKEALIEARTPEWQYGWAADEERRKTMSPRGPRIMIDGLIDTPENLAAFPKGKRIRRAKAGPWEEVS